MADTDTSQGGSGSAPGLDTDRTSVFDVDKDVGAEYVRTAWATDDGLKETGYFALSSNGSLLGDDVLSADAAKRFWRMIILDFAEQHKEKYACHNTLSDGIAVYALGASPIIVNISGVVLLDEKEDDCFAFLKEYVGSFRARRLAKEDKTLLFVCRDTTMKILLDSVTFAQSYELEGYADITFSGVAYRYKMADSVEKPNYGYYGRTPKPTPGTSASSGQQQQQQQQQQQSQGGSEQDPNFVGPPKPSDPETDVVPAPTA